MEKQQSWGCTLITQLTLCVVLYIALSIGQPSKPIYGHGTKDVYFVSVRGGFRSLKQQTHLLKQIEKVAKAYKVGFVINISDLGEDDPLLQNATQYFPPLKVPWYMTRASKQGQESDYFVKRIKISHGKTLAVVVLNTGSLQDVSGADENIQFQWLSRTLEASNSNWHIAVGLDPLVNCGQNIQGVRKKENLDPLYHLLLKYGVNAYLSGEPCVNDDVLQRGNSLISSSNTGSKVGGPYFTPITREPLHHETELVNGFLLHRVSALEIVTYAVTFEGDIMHKSSVHQSGRDVM